jgi:formylmethanofuran dehydrogenase subunit E
MAECERVAVMTDPYCSSCHELLSGDRHEHFYNRPLCDDCLFDSLVTEDNLR